VNSSIIRVVHLLLPAVSAGLLALAPAALAVPFTPADDALVLERLPARAADPAQRELRALRQAHAADPADMAAALRPARHYFDLAGADGDPRYVGYAEAALRRWNDPAGAPAEVLIVQAQLAQYRHEFGRALQLLDRALQASPGDPEALAWRAAVRMVRGEYAASRADCAQLQAVASELLATGCTAYVEATTGQTRQAYERLASTLARHPDVRATLRRCGWSNV
jgi:hypothetical protein